MQAGRAAVDRLLRRYEPLARHFARARRGQGLSIEDLVSVAREGLWKGILSFRRERGNQFSTHAATIIQNEISTAFRNLPATGSYVPRRATEFEQQRQDLAAEIGRDPSDAEVFESLGWTRLERENFAKGKRLLATEQLEGETVGRLKMVPVSRERDPRIQFEEREKLAQLHAAIGKLDEISQEVIRQRFWGDGPVGQRAIGETLGLTRDEVRAIEKAALESLKRMLEQLEHPQQNAERT